VLKAIRSVVSGVSDVVAFHDEGGIYFVLRVGDDLNGSLDVDSANSRRCYTIADTQGVAAIDGSPQVG